MTSACKNCDRPLVEDFSFCPSCGQRTDIQRLRMREILADFWSHITDIDKGFFTLLRDLVIRPGSVAREYIVGKRKKHFGPLSFYLIVGTLLILSMNITEWVRARSQTGADEPVSSINAPATGVQKESYDTQVQPSARDSLYLKGITSQDAANARVAKVHARRQQAGKFWMQYSDLVSIGAAPMLCLFFWIVYRMAGLNYTELLVACLYMMGFTNLVFALIASPVSSILSAITSGRAQLIVTGIFKVFEIAYFAYFFSQFTEGIVRRPVLRASFSAVFVSAFWTVLTFALMTLYMATGFGLD